MRISTCFRNNYYELNCRDGSRQTEARRVIEIEPDLTFASVVADSIVTLFGSDGSSARSKAIVAVTFIDVFIYKRVHRSQSFHVTNASLF